MQLREARKQEMKEQIFLQAIQLFEQRGFEQVTIEEITKACGIAKGTFYNYFAKKEEVLLYLGKSQVDLLIHSDWSKVDIPTVKGKIICLFSELIYRYQEHTALMKLTIVELMRHSLSIQDEFKLIRQLHHILMDLLAEGQATDEIASHHSTADLANALTAIYFFALLSWASSDQNADELKRLFLSQFEAVWSGFQGVVR